jgi:hypothetical protein
MNKITKNIINKNNYFHYKRQLDNINKNLIIQNKNNKDNIIKLKQFEDKITYFSSISRENYLKLNIKIDTRTYLLFGIVLYYLIYK